MYDRDYLKALEREMELSSGDNRFQGWRLTSERESASQASRESDADRPEQDQTRSR
jgi:hypothetical protein